MGDNRTLALCCVGLVIAVGGCSGSDSSGGMFTPSGQPTEADVAAVMQAVVLPLVGGTADPNPQSATSLGPSAVRESCTSIPCLNEGTAEVCSDTAEADIVWSYEACERPHGLVDGVVTFVGGLDDATMTFEIAIEALALSGSVGWQLEGLCAELTYGDFSAVAPDQSATIDGHTRSCLFGTREGQLDVAIVKPGLSFTLHLDFDGLVGTATAVGEDGTISCSIDMASAEADCIES